MSHHSQAILRVSHPVKDPRAGEDPKGTGTGVGGGASNVLASVPWIAQWKFNNDGNDSIGANNLTNNNSATFTTGKLGGATGATQLVAASSQYWSITDNAALSMGTGVDFTICAWVYADTVSNARVLLAKNRLYSTAAFTEYGLGLTGSAIQFEISNGTTQQAVVWGANLTAATWTLVIAWYDSSAETAYLSLDNAAAVSGALSGGAQDAAGPFRIGWDNGNGIKWNGRIDNVCIAKSAAGAGGVLTASQRSAFYAAGVGTEQLT